MNGTLQASRVCKQNLYHRVFNYFLSGPPNTVWRKTMNGWTVIRGGFPLEWQLSLHGSRGRHWSAPTCQPGFKSLLTALRRPRCHCKTPPPGQKHKWVDTTTVCHTAVFFICWHFFILFCFCFQTYVSAVLLYPGRVILLQKSCSVAVHSCHGQCVNVGKTSCDLMRDSDWGTSA